MLCPCVAWNTGAILTSLILSYVLTSVVNGFVSARLYRQLGGKNWTWNIVTAGQPILQCHR